MKDFFSTKKRRFFLTLVLSFLFAVVPIPSQAFDLGSWEFRPEEWSDMDPIGDPDFWSNPTDVWCSLTGICPTEPTDPTEPTEPTPSPNTDGMCPSVTYSVAVTFAPDTSVNGTPDSPYQANPYSFNSLGSFSAGSAPNNYHHGFTDSSGTMHNSSAPLTSPIDNYSYYPPLASASNPCPNGEQPDPAPDSDIPNTPADPPPGGEDPPPPGDDDPPPGDDDPPPGGEDPPPPGDDDETDDLPNEMSCQDLEFPNLFETLALFEDKFPFGAIDFQPSGTPTQCMMLNYFGQEYELCAVRDFLSGAKWVIWIVYLAKVILYL